MFIVSHKNRVFIFSKHALGIYNQYTIFVVHLNLTIIIDIIIKVMVDKETKVRNEHDY